jgi:hypothetical protein
MHYALKHNKYGLLGVSVSSNGDDAEFCNESTVTLSTHEENPWLSSNKTNVDKVLDGEGVPWYNSDMNHPELGSLKAKDIEIIEVEIG